MSNLFLIIPMTINPQQTELLQSQLATRAEKFRLRNRILEGILVGISKADAINKKMVLRGAGALHFFYSSPRYSADLDFALPNFEYDGESIHDFAKNQYFSVD